MAGDYFRVECPDCGNEQTVFEKAASEVRCAVCGSTLATPTGGKADLTGEVVDTVQSRG
ncbi:30S ribosomal protein S27e [Halobacteriales archaeon QS_8_69_26]|nr:MAG: 30S ribosomal protein S27e [Halobacteriales archaeon QS_8_69_26]